ncbi:MAG: hypothetical protein U0U70_01880 [Chitinophagaceae bacterium]
MKLFENSDCHHTMLNTLKNILKTSEELSGITCSNQLDHLCDVFSSCYAELKSRIEAVPDEIKEDWMVMLKAYKQKMKVILN